MKTFFLHALVLLTTLGLEVGCRKEVDIVLPEFPIQELVWDEPCLISRTIYKTVVSYGPYIDPEQITIGGKTFKVGVSEDICYTYDDRGRVVLERMVQQKIRCIKPTAIRSDDFT